MPTAHAGNKNRIKVEGLTISARSACPTGTPLPAQPLLTGHSCVHDLAMTHVCVMVMRLRILYYLWMLGSRLTLYQRCRPGTETEHGKLFPNFYPDTLWGRRNWLWAFSSFSPLTAKYTVVSRGSVTWTTSTCTQHFGTRQRCQWSPHR